MSIATLEFFNNLVVGGKGIQFKTIIYKDFLFNSRQYKISSSSSNHMNLNSYF